uniref:Neprosin domain-containing protein n=1 Tax=Bursaphelenchus xylophilus TaxID=6326 RepID=A0A1I7SIP2_BURXY
MAMSTPGVRYYHKYGYGGRTDHPKSVCPLHGEGFDVAKGLISTGTSTFTGL